MFKVRVKAWLSGGLYHLKPNLHQTWLPFETKPRGNNVASPFSLLMTKVMAHIRTFAFANTYIAVSLLGSPGS